MVIFENKVMLHNVEALIEVENGYKMSRLSIEAKDAMELSQANHGGASTASTGVEVRFVIESGNEAFITVYCEDQDIHTSRIAYLRLGDFQYGWLWLGPYVMTPGLNRIPIKLPYDMDRLQKIADQYGHAFSPRVVRLCFHAGGVLFVGAEGDIRPPKADEMPARRAVFYGSSITHGSLANQPFANYVSLTSLELGLDPLNKGLAGSCNMENRVVDDILSHDNAAFYQVEVATNCADRHPVEELRNRVRYLCDRFLALRPDSHLFVIDGLWTQDKYDPYRQMVKETVESYADDRITYIPGRSLVPDISYVTTDGIHPTLQGHLNATKVLLPLYRSVL